MFDNKFLNDFIDLGNQAWHETRVAIQTIFSDHKYSTTIAHALFDHSTVSLTLPVFIRDYTDFYSSYMRPDNPLFPNWKHIPIGYHGRASSVVVSGTNLKRPKGQKAPKPDDPDKKPSFSESIKLDYELEMGLIVGKGNKLGEPISITEAGNHIFGLVIVNDWSARAIQFWAY